MRISVLHDWEPDYQQELTWQDGLAAALFVLRQRGHEVQIFTVGPDRVIHNPLHDIIQSSDVVKAISEWGPEVILHWADMTRQHVRPLQLLGLPMAICFAGGDVLGENLPFFEHIFVESSVYAKQLEGKTDATVSLAFGTNTALFDPNPTVLPKQWDTIFPATFAAWKRHYLYALATEGTGIEAVAMGYQYDDHEQDCWQECLNRGVTIMPHLAAPTLRGFYAASRVGVITSSSAGGSQRTLLEMLAMNLPVVITDSDKFDDYILGLDSVIRADPNPNSIRDAIYEAATFEGQTESREHVLKYWSETSYTDALEAGLRRLCA